VLRGQEVPAESERRRPSASEEEDVRVGEEGGKVQGGKKIQGGEKMLEGKGGASV
jgi:hypothetical protein